MCKCLNDIKEKLLEQCKDNIKDPITIAYWGNVEMLSGRTFQVLHVETKKENAKRSKEHCLNMFHNYCPFCGKPYEKGGER
jgi:hypothetical protein